MQRSCKLANKNIRIKKHIWCSINIVSNEKWFDIIESTFDRFTNAFKQNIKIYDSNFELLVKYYIEKIKPDLMIPNVLSHMLLCKRFSDENFD